MRNLGGLSKEDFAGLEVLRGRSVVSFGDSVDREYVLYILLSGERWRRERGTKY
jgi:hypothetical protein